MPAVNSGPVGATSGQVQFGGGGEIRTHETHESREGLPVFGTDDSTFATGGNRSTSVIVTGLHLRSVCQRIICIGVNMHRVCVRQKAEQATAACSAANVLLFVVYRDVVSRATFGGLQR
jgi:hypothetical protein